MIEKKKVISGLLALMMGVISLLPLNLEQAEAAEYWPNNVSVASDSAIVMEVETGVILYQKNMDVQHYPASITKVLTGLVAAENSEMDEVVTFSHDAVYLNEGDTSHISRDVDEKMTMEQCLYGMMLESANECAYAIAEHVAGTEDAFVDMMNEKAKQLGCTQSHFNNTNGLPDPDHYTSAHDMGLIARAAIQNPKMAEIMSTGSYTIGPTNKHDVDTLLNNHHCMLHYYKTNQYIYEGCLGGKTGYTTFAHFTLVTYARRNGMTLACVVLDNPKKYGQFEDTTALLDYCFDNFSCYPVSEQAQLFDRGSDSAGILSDYIDLIKIDTSGRVVLPKTADFSKTKSTVVPATQEGDSVIANVEYTYADRYVGGAKLLYTQSQKASYPFHNLDVEDGGSAVHYLRIDFQMIFLILLAAAVLLALLYYLHLRSGDILLYRHRKLDRLRRKKSHYKTIRTIRRRRRHRR